VDDSRDAIGDGLLDGDGDGDTGGGVGDGETGPTMPVGPFWPGPAPPVPALGGGTLSPPIGALILGFGVGVGVLGPEPFPQAATNAASAIAATTASAKGRSSLAPTPRALLSVRFIDHTT
jgi:hypothetical protein